MFRFAGRLLALMTVLALPACAVSMPAPEGPVVLTVTGALPVTNAPDAASFDLALLAEIGEASFHTSTIWTEGTKKFTGTPLKALLDRLQVTAGSLRAIALNDYHADIPVETIDAEAPLLVWAVDGDRLTVRNRGPLWIVYPYDLSDKYRSDQIFSRSVWQLNRIEVRSNP